MKPPTAAFASALLLAAGGAHAATGTASGGNASAPLNATARLDFLLNIGRFIFFRVGPSAYPATSTTPGSAVIVMQPSIPAVPVQPAVSGNSVPVPWSGAAPSFAAVAATVPVQVQSNAGAISIRASVVTPLTSGANAIPLSQILVGSSDAGLPAPPLPNAGTGAAVTVTGTSFGNLVTQRSADWSFSYNPAVLPPPGTYTGQISFTAVSP